MARIVATTLLAALAAAVAQGYNNGVGRKPPLGWNTWCTGGPCGLDVCNEDEIKSVAKALKANGMYDLGYTRVNMDDCWGGPRAPDGSYQPDPDRFPSGMKALASWLHNNGFTLGVYTDAGVHTCSQGQRPYKIPGAYGHYKQDAHTFASWGVDFVKMDWCNTIVNGSALDPETQYNAMSEALNSTGRSILFNTCEWGLNEPWLWAPNIANTWRIAPDHHDNWWSTFGVIEALAGKSAFAGPYAWNDPDFVYTGGQGCDDRSMRHCPGQTDDEYRTEFAIWSITASQLLVATDVRNLTAIMKDVLLNEEAVAVHQDDLLDAGDRVGYDDTCGSFLPGSCQLWARNLTGGAVAVGYYNADAVARNVTGNFSVLHPTWNEHTAVHVRDIWEHRDLGVHVGSFQATNVPSHGTGFYKLTPLQFF